MSQDRPALLQLCSVMPTLERSLADAYDVQRAFDAASCDAAVAAAGARIRAVVTGGHIGIANAVVDRLPALEIIAINGVGYDRVDLEHARARGVRVTNTPDVLTDDVADLAIGLAIALLRRLPQADRYVREGRWPDGDMPLSRRFSAQRFGLFGLGRIGKAIARRLQGFGVTIAYSGRVRQDVPYAFCADLITLARQSDVLVIAAAATPATTRIVDRAVLDALGADGVLVNVARGSIIDEAQLIAALAEGRIGGAALDVFATEPTVPEALRAAPNVVLAPHIGSATMQTRQAMADLVWANLAAHFAGRPLPTAVA